MLINWHEGHFTEKTEAIWQDILHPFFLLASGYHLPNKTHLHDVWDSDPPNIPFLLHFKLCLNSSIFLLAYKHDTCLSQESSLSFRFFPLKEQCIGNYKTLTRHHGVKHHYTGCDKHFPVWQPKHNKCKNKEFGLCLNWKLLCSKDTFNLE